MLNIVVLSQSLERSRQMVAVLEEMADRVLVVSNIALADAAVQKINACCIFFNRDFASDYLEFFSLFKNKSIYFVPISNRDDNMDIVAALNTQRAAYYLKEPVSHAELALAVKNLRIRMRNPL